MALKERGIDKLVDDAREDNKDNDAAFLGRKKCKSFRAFRETGADILGQPTGTGFDGMSALVEMTEVRHNLS